jgi:23S rRNA (guanosine2251-2'-O)-methyltransferase
MNKDLELLYGFNVCDAVLKNNNRQIERIFLLEEKSKEYLKSIHHSLHNKVERLSSKQMFIKTGEQHKHQGFAILASRYKCFSDVSNIFQNSEQKQTVLILDGVQDPHNLGNIIRTAFCLGVKNIIITQHDSCDINNTVARSSAGYLDYVNVHKVGNLQQTIEKLKKNNFWVIGFDSNVTDKTTTFAQTMGKYEKIALVFGSEGFGMKDLTKKNCDLLVKIPINEQADSLNVCTAVTIALYERGGVGE